MAIKALYGPVRTSRTQALALGGSAMIIAMLLAQLYSFEDFSIVLGDVLPMSDSMSLQVVAAVVVIVELFSLPYLLGMYLSALMRVMSALFACLVSAFWLVMALTNAHSTNNGLFSSVFEVHGGIVPAVWSILLVVLIASVIAADSKFRHDTTS